MQNWDVAILTTGRNIVEDFFVKTVCVGELSEYCKYAENIHLAFTHQKLLNIHLFLAKIKMP